MNIPPEHHFDVFLFEVQECAIRQKMPQCVVHAVEQIFSIVREKKFDPEKSAKKVRHELYRSIFILEDDSTEEMEKEKLFSLAERANVDKEELHTRVLNVVTPFIELHFPNAVKYTNLLYRWLLSKYEHSSEEEINIPILTELTEGDENIKISERKTIEIKNNKANVIEGEIVNVHPAKISRKAQAKSTRNTFEKQIAREEKDDGVIIRRVVSAKGTANKKNSPKKKMTKEENTKKRTKIY